MKLSDKHKIMLLQILTDSISHGKDGIAKFLFTHQARCDMFCDILCYQAEGAAMSYQNTEIEDGKKTN